MMNLEHKKACNKESLAKVVEHASGQNCPLQWKHKQSRRKQIL